jgi:hypothetical protein
MVLSFNKLTYNRIYSLKMHYKLIFNVCIQLFGSFIINLCINYVVVIDNVYCVILKVLSIDDIVDNDNIIVGTCENDVRYVIVVVEVFI